MSPKNRGRPTPSAARFARYGRRGKPAWPVPLNGAPAAADALVSRCSTQPGFPRLRLGRRGYAPRLAADAWARLWSAGAASANRLPPARNQSLWGELDSGGCSWTPCPTLRAAPLRRSATARRLRAFWLAAFVARTVASPCESSRQSSDATTSLGAVMRLPPPESVAHLLATFTQAGQPARAFGTACAPSPGP